MKQPAMPSMKHSGAGIRKVDQNKSIVEKIWKYGKERDHKWFSPVTSLTDYMPVKNSVVVYSATAGATFNMATDVLNPHLNHISMNSNGALKNLSWKSNLAVLQATKRCRWI